MRRLRYGSPQSRLSCHLAGNMTRDRTALAVAAMKISICGKLFRLARGRNIVDTENLSSCNASFETDVSIPILSKHAIWKLISRRCNFPSLVNKSESIGIRVIRDKRDAVTSTRSSRKASRKLQFLYRANIVQALLMTSVFPSRRDARRYAVSLSPRFILISILVSINEIRST